MLDSSESASLALPIRRQVAFRPLLARRGGFFGSPAQRGARTLVIAWGEFRRVWLGFMLVWSKFRENILGGVEWKFTGAVYYAAGV